MESDDTTLLPTPYERPWERSELAASRSALRDLRPGDLRVGVLGDGLAALASAHYLARAGIEPVVLASSSIGGWLAERFPVGPHRFDCFHMPISRSDSALCGLLAELDLLPRVAWRATELALYACDVPRLIRSWSDLREVRRAQRTQLRRWRGWTAPSGARTGSSEPAGCCHTDLFEGWWHRGLRAESCVLCESEGSRISRAQLRQMDLGAERVIGYLRGGHRTLLDALATSISLRGGQLLRGIRLLGLEADAHGAMAEWDTDSAHFDALLSTLPLPTLTKLGRGPLVRSLPFSAGSPRIEISVVVQLERPLALPYLTLPFGSRARFQKIYNAGPLLPEEERGGLLPVYLVREAELNSERSRCSDEDLIADAFDFLRSPGVGFDPGAVAAVQVFRAPDLDLTWDREPLQRPPSRRLGETCAYLCTPARPFPRSRTPETSVILARDTASQIAYQI